MEYSVFPILSSLINRYSLPGKITSYLEIGVSDGHTLFNTIHHYPDISDLVLCDNWLEAYGGAGRGNHGYIESKLIEIQFPLVQVTFLDGDSQIKIPGYFALNPHKMFDLIFIDGDHSHAGLHQDLVNTIDHANILIVHDIRHPSHLYLRDVFYKFYETVHEFFILVDDGQNMGMLLAKTFLNWNDQL